MHFDLPEPEKAKCKQRLFSGVIRYTRCGRKVQPVRSQRTAGITLFSFIALSILRNSYQGCQLV